MFMFGCRYSNNLKLQVFRSGVIVASYRIIGDRPGKRRENDGTMFLLGRGHRYSNNLKLHVHRRSALGKRKETERTVFKIAVKSGRRNRKRNPGQSSSRPRVQGDQSQATV